MLPEVVVVVDIAQGFVQELVSAGDGHDSREVELLVIGAMGAFQMGVLLRMPLMVLNELAPEVGDELAQLLHLEPGLAPEFLAMVNSKDDVGANAMAAQPGDSPEVEAQAVGPGPLSGIGDELEAGGHVQGAPLVVGYVVAVQVEELLPGEGFVVPDVFQVHLDHLKGLGSIPVYKGPRWAAALTGPRRAQEPMAVASQDMADCGPGQLKLLVFGQVEGEPFGA